MARVMEVRCLRIALILGAILLSVVCSPSATGAAQIYWQGCGTLSECVEPGGLLFFPDTPTPPFSVIEIWFPGGQLVSGSHVWIGGWIDTDLLSYCQAAIMPQGESGQCTCCHVRTGNVDGDYLERRDISDLSALIGYCYLGMPAPTCMAAANCDGSVDGNVDIADLSALIDYLYISFMPTALCQ